ncbi:carbonic anhydrase 14-like [Gastrophryne carolinensis]
MIIDIRRVANNNSKTLLMVGFYFKKEKIYDGQLLQKGVPEGYYESKTEKHLYRLAISPRRGERSSWTYTGDHGQEHWADSFPDCGGAAQSPINIKTGNVTYDASLPPIEPIGYGIPGSAPFTLTNNGHTVKVSLPPSMRLRGLLNNYTAVQLHLHWGSEAQPGGSEHQVDDHTYPGELHIVHYNSDKFSSFNEAKDKASGLAVLGILITTGSSDNHGYANIINYLESVSFADQSTPVPPFNVEELLPGSLERYFRYSGSLTTPPCFQSVTWTVFSDPVQISRAQMEKLRSALCSSPVNHPPKVLENNVRLTQPLNQRNVYSSFMITEAFSAGVILAIVFGVLGGALILSAALYAVIKVLRMQERILPLGEMGQQEMKHGGQRAAVGACQQLQLSVGQKEYTMLGMTNYRAAPTIAGFHLHRSKKPPNNAEFSSKL